MGLNAYHAFEVLRVLGDPVHLCKTNRAHIHHYRDEIRELLRGLENRLDTIVVEEEAKRESALPVVVNQEQDLPRWAYMDV